MRSGLAAVASVIAALLGLEGWAGYRVACIKPSIFVPSSRIAPVFLKATVAMEDGNFYRHGAIDLQAIGHAIQANIQDRRNSHGGSTISQQLAKNLFLTKERTWGRKFLEVFLANELERQWGKDRILETYVNTIDYGMGQHGIEAAARCYFHKSPIKLTLAESALLVGLVPYSPKKWLSKELAELQRSKAIGRISYWFPDEFTQAELDSALNQPISSMMPDFPE